MTSPPMEPSASVLGQPASPPLGRLVEVPIREVWYHEAHSFTPWLLENADALGDALGMDLDLSHAEHPVGSYSLDLLGVDRATSEPVIVENQLEGTDHSHLGQLLTYAAGTDAVNVVWVAASFRAEHRAALDWLNQRTDTNTRFFGVEVTTVRIGTSEPAPLFRLVAEPNDWGKQVRTSAQAQEGGSSERGMLYRSFWERFLEALRQDFPGWSKARRAPLAEWFTMATGTSGAEYTCSFGRRGLLSEIYFKDPDPDVNTARFNALSVQRETLESVFGAPLLFEDLPTRKGCRIGVLREGNVDHEDDWDEYINWFLDSQRRLRQAMTAVGGVPTVG